MLQRNVMYEAQPNGANLAHKTKSVAASRKKEDADEPADTTPKECKDNHHDQPL